MSIDKSGKWWVGNQPDDIAILEDSAERQQAMQAALADALPDATCVFFDSAHAIIKWLKTNLGSVSLISLDHDLDFLTGPEGKLIDPGDGRDVARTLAAQKPCCPVIVHTSNSVAASSMMFTLQDAGWQAERVLPEADLTWVEDRWKPTVLRLLTKGSPAKTGAKPQAEYAAVVEDAVARCRDRFAADGISVYLTGSVATGEALVGVSDVDFFCFHRGQGRPDDIDWSKRTCADLHTHHGDVAVEFHLNLFPLDRLRQDSFWRFMLRYNSIRLLGADTLAALEQEGHSVPVPSASLAIGRRAFVTKCLEQVMAGQAPDSLGVLPEDPSLATRKLVRNFVLVEGAYLLMLDGHFTAFTRASVVPHLRTLFPQWQELYELSDHVLDHPYDSGVTPSGYMAACEPFVRFILARLAAPQT